MNSFVSPAYDVGNTGPRTEIVMDQKLENILNLALETPEEEREQTESLNVGYSAEIRSWELIVKYHGSLDRLPGTEYCGGGTDRRICDPYGAGGTGGYGIGYPGDRVCGKTQAVLLWTDVSCGDILFSTGHYENAFSEWKGRSFGCTGFRDHLGSGGVPEGRWQYEDTLSMGPDSPQGSDAATGSDSAGENR